jgi:hypothetical protein
VTQAYLFGDFLGGCAFSESVVKSSVDILQVTATTGSGGSSSFGFGGPVESASNGRLLLLDVVRSASSDSTQNVGLVITSSSRRGTFCHFLPILSC